MIYQIYFDDKTKAHCRKEWEGIDNSGRLTPYAESEVIRRTIVNPDDKWHGVLSWKAGIKTSWPESLLDNLMHVSTADLIGFHLGQNLRGHDIFAHGDSHYFARNDGAFFRLCAEIVEASGYNWAPTRTPRFAPTSGRGSNCIIQANYVIARPEIYQAFIDELLHPAMSAMLLPEFGSRLWRTMPGMRIMGKYSTITPEIKAQFDAWIDGVHGQHRPEYIPANLTYWPLHCFVAEELWSIWLNRKALRMEFIC